MEEKPKERECEKKEKYIEAREYEKWIRGIVEEEIEEKKKWWKVEKRSVDKI